MVDAWVDAGACVMVAGHALPEGSVAVGRNRVPTRRIKVWRGLGRAGRAASYFLSILGLVLSLRDKVDVVYCRGLGDAVVSIAVLKSLRLCRWPVLACPINARGSGDVSYIRSIPGWRWIARRIDRHIEAINLINGLVEEELDSIGIRSPEISRVPNGIALSAPVERGAPGLRRLVWTGRLEKQKGLDLLFIALAALPSRLPEWRLRLYGDGPLKQELVSQLKSLGLRDLVTIHDSVPREAVRGLLADSDAFVLPSRYEGMSNSAIEAMEAGLPVICTRCGGIDDFVGSAAGWVCEPDSVESLRLALERALLAPPSDWLEKGVNARRIVERHLSIATTAGGNLAIMRRLAAGC
nr:glycosyltransferase family 4 protein [Arenimonas sp. SCN 70-307]